MCYKTNNKIYLYEFLSKINMIDTKLLRQEQAIKAKQIILADNFVTPNLITGADVGFEEKGTVTRAEMVAMHWPSLAIIE